MANKIKILLVEDDKNMQEAFAFCINRNPSFLLVGQTGKQKEGIEYLTQDTIDALILDLELQEGDGIHFLEEMKELNRERPLVIVITNNRSETVLEYLRASGADFICQKCNESYSPMMVLNIIERTLPFHNHTKNHAMEVISYQQSLEERYRRKRIEEELSLGGFQTTYKGVRYVIDCIYITLYESNHLNVTMRQLYEKVAKNHHTKAVNVEKSIRDSIERVWNKENPRDLELFYPYPISTDSGCPSNQEFVHNMVKKIGSL